MESAKGSPMPQFTVEFGKDGPPPEDGRLDAAAFHRNHAAIAAALDEFLQGRSGNVLEGGSGTAQHAVAYASRWPAITWWPTDVNDNHLRSVAARRVHTKLDNVKTPVRLDASQNEWRLPALGLPSSFIAIFCANVVHISPWAVAEGLFDGAARHLAPDGRLFLYGPFKRDGKHTALSNAVFDTSLRDRDAEWGVRDIGDMEKLAGSVGLGLVEIAEMPANNLIL